ncbi:uncharacterized protein FMAN_10583 [Fusarium mangiferae]|uniref:YAG7-like dimerisation domain-containing protein n=1 Tax=Fusarium mangiferae TaxID=192010 RepID=A0A1L7U4M6_FUSMA|nr:uncharacterized protein FMAN_10583 [Fusarium mangiferae]KAI1016235.1 hypothetical protein LB504_009063 [Fusarium proliferatum]CVL05710.1 uncharacterized protein FMAN_10583 [Fusarium mangiferae]
MAAQAVQPSKSAKKKAAKALERTESPAPSVASATADKNSDDSFESPYIKEIQKNIRNVNKKITNASKTDSLLSQNPGKSLDELVESRIINNDQKAQILKKPALQAQLAQYEEQLVQYQKVDEQYRTRAASDKAEWEKNLEKAKADAVAEAKAESTKSLHDNLLVLSQFLRLAAYRREEAQDPDSDESQAIEGVLLAIYSGDENAVQSMLKLVNGSEDQIYSVPGEQLQTSFSKVKALAQEYKTHFDEPQPAEGEAEHVKDVATDPTIAHAAATEIEAGDTAAPVVAEPSSTSNGLANASVADDAANAVAESHWDTSNDLSTSQEWVDVKPAEAVEADATAPTRVANTHSWADDHPETTAPADPNDGFHQVQRKGPRNEGGNHRGRGRGEHRGRGGFRGDGRGRGRGRGGAGRGGRRGDEA